MNKLNNIGETIDDLVQEKDLVVTSNVTVLDIELKRGTVLVSFDGGINYSQYMANVYDNSATYVDGDVVYYKGIEYKYVEGDTKTSTLSPSNSSEWEFVRVVDFNGILLDDLSQTDEAAVLVAGRVVASQIIGLSSYDEVTNSLFRNKIVLI